MQNPAAQKTQQKQSTNQPKNHQNTNPTKTDRIMNLLDTKEKFTLSITS